MLWDQIKVGFNALQIIIRKIHLVITKHNNRKDLGCKSYQMSSLLQTMNSQIHKTRMAQISNQLFCGKILKSSQYWDLEVFSLLCLVWVLGVVIEWESNHLEISLWKMKYESMEQCNMKYEIFVMKTQLTYLKRK